MNIQDTFQDLLNNPWLRKIPAPQLVGSLVASAVHTALSAAGFNLPGASETLSTVGFKIGATLLPSVVEAAKGGIDTLGDWLSEQIPAEPEVNEAAAATLATTVKETSQALSTLAPADAEKVVAKLGDGMRSAGGATAAIAGDFAKGIAPGADPAAVQQQMLDKVAAWGRQSIEARRGSLIENARQHIAAGASGEQKIAAEDQSTIRNVSQDIG